MFSISQYEKHVHNSTHYKTSFNLLNTPVYVANSIRRALSSMVPTITFDDAHYEDMSLMSIKITKNTSALHDQFLSHRISYIPINMDGNPYFNIESKLNGDTDERSFVFSKSPTDVRFKLSKQNNISQNPHRDKQGLIDVTTDDFLVIDENGGGIIETGDFFKPDVFTGDYVLLNKLKQDLGNEEGGEELVMECIPRIGMGRFSSKNDPTGTVTYQMHLDTDAAIDAVFHHKKTHLNKERKKKGLDNFTAIEEKQFRKSFDLLDKDRVIKTDGNGNPNSFQFSVESIGFLNPDSIIIDALGVLVLTLKDIQNSFTFHSDKYGFETTRKVYITALDDSNINTGINIKVKNENHTIGNMLSNIVRNMWCHMGTDVEEPILKIASYKMDHPTIEDIDFILIPENKTTPEMIKYIELLYAHDRSLYQAAKSDSLTSKSREYIVELLCVLLFQKSINKCINHLLDIKLKLCAEMDPEDIKNVTFLVRDDEEYMSKNIELVGNVNFSGSGSDYPHLTNLSSILGRPGISPTEPSFDGASPTYQANSPTYQANSPTYQANSPTYQANSPTYQANSPKYDGASPKYDGASPKYDGASPKYDGASPKYSGKGSEYTSPVKGEPESPGVIVNSPEVPVDDPVTYTIPVPKWLSSAIMAISDVEYNTIMRFLSKDYTNHSGEDKVVIILDQIEDTSSSLSETHIVLKKQLLELNYESKTYRRINRTTKTKR
jgi:DNA-directed RNA polymerase subunit L